MAYWLDDGFDTWPEVIRAGSAAAGLYVRCGAWIARNLTDGHVPAEVATMYGTPEWIKRLVEVGLWETDGPGYRDVFYFTMGNPTAETVRARRAAAARRQALVRDPALREAVRTRDHDRCRYCGVVVRWSDRKGAKGGTYDHVDPAGPNTFDNLVVCCRGCNSAKRDRTPSEAGMTLRPVPGSNLDTAQNGSRSDPVSLRPPALPPSKEGQGRAPAQPPDAPHTPEDPRRSPLVDRPQPIAKPPDLTAIKNQLKEASAKAHATGSRREGRAFDELVAATDPDATNPAENR